MAGERHDFPVPRVLVSTTVRVVVTRQCTLSWIVGSPDASATDIVALAHVTEGR